ncbi:MAG: hypothetical protein HFI73_05265 [Bacilli bacterium]|jgi:hypothetical protein|nr:hypothetical protein [Bacilli bacterium]
MKKIFLGLIALLMFVPSMVVNASNASVSVTASNTVMVGNSVTVTVTFSSSSLIGSWEADLGYDKNLLKLTNSSAEGGGTYMVNVAQNGTKSKKYTFTFKALKSGSAKISINSFTLYDYTTMKEMQTTSNSKTISIKTKDQIEASYSDNANLKSLTVGDYLLSPSFSKNVKEYNVEVPNDVESIVINASKEDANASIDGSGEKTLVEGNNKFNIVVTAQKGNSQTYVVNVYRKELNPISVTINDQNYTLVRKEENLPEYKTFIKKTIMYEDTEIPALYSESTGRTLIGVKDDDGNISTYIYEDGKIKDLYIEIYNYAYSLLPLKLKESDLFKEYEKTSIEIGGEKVEAYRMPGSKYAVIYAESVETGEENYYSYFISDGSFQVYNKDISQEFVSKLTNYKYVIYGLIAFVVLQFLILIFIPKRKKKDKKKKQEYIKTIDSQIDDEIKEEIKNNKTIKEEINKSNKKIEKEFNTKVEKTEDNEIKLIKK